MEKIYVIQSSGGSYDDSWHNDLFAVRGEEQAQAEVAKLEQLHAECKGVWLQVHKALSDGYVDVRALLSQDLKLPPEPRGPAKPTKEALADFKKKYAAWRQECEPIWHAQQLEQERVMKLAYKASHDKAVELGSTEEHLKMFGFFDEHGGLKAPSFDDSASYSYEELELRGAGAAMSFLPGMLTMVS